jgi:lipid II:glycine glycyltransferase (peptidoglycan interpeptide bridge formation enzyme)
MDNGEYIQSITGCGLAACEGAGSFLQSAFWGTFKSRFGWESRAFLVNWRGFGERPLLVLYRRLAPGLAMAYVPWGPELPDNFPTGLELFPALAELAKKLRRLLPRGAAFIRFDPPWFAEEGAVPFPPPPFFKRAAADVQPPDTVMVNLAESEENILAAMKPKWRYNIGLAEKRGVTVQRPDEQGLAIFYRLLAETAVRDGIAIHSREYYQTLFELCRNDGNLMRNGRAELRLYTAEHEGDFLAAIVVLCRLKTATYLYGASSNVKRNLMAPYALQWQAMRDAKALGCLEYDLFGIPPSDDPSHPMAGLYRFKTGFGGTIIHRGGSWDYAYQPLFRALFNTAEKLRKRIRDVKKNRR